MILVALFIGAILSVAAVRNSQGALFAALGTDVPAFTVWAAAIVALGAIGFAPGLKPVSRGLLALVVITLLLRNYTQILSGFENAWKNPGAYVPSKADPTAGALQKDIAGAQAHDASGSGLIHDLASASEYAGLSGAW